MLRTCKNFCSTLEAQPDGTVRRQHDLRRCRPTVPGVARRGDCAEIALSRTVIHLGVGVEDLHRGAPAHDQHVLGAGRAAAGQPVPGLYAVGNEASGFWGGRYPQIDGLTLLFAFNSGRIAGESAAVDLPR